MKPIVSAQRSSLHDTGWIGDLPEQLSPKETMDRLATAVTDRDITVLARIDHAEAAAKVGMTLRSTEVIIFDNPRAGTPLMQTRQTIGIDLPSSGRTMRARPGWPITIRCGW